MSRISSGILFALAVASIGGCQRRSEGLRPAVIPADSVSDGYGTRAKGEAGGIQSVSLEEKQNRKVSRVEELLEGLPGLEVKRAGNAYSVTMRGVGSFMSSEQVLFVIDGTPYQGNLGWLNPADVVRIDLLKNPNETALYGVRGANGVVVITTKRKQ